MSADTTFVVVIEGPSGRAFAGVLQDAYGIVSDDPAERLALACYHVGNSKPLDLENLALGLSPFDSFEAALATMPGIVDAWEKSYSPIEYETPLVVRKDGLNVRELRPKHEDATMWV